MASTEPSSTEAGSRGDQDMFERPTSRVSIAERASALLSSLEHLCSDTKHVNVSQVKWLSKEANALILCRQFPSFLEPYEDFIGRYSNGPDVPYIDLFHKFAEFMEQERKRWTQTTPVKSRNALADALFKLELAQREVSSLTDLNKSQTQQIHQFETQVTSLKETVSDLNQKLNQLTVEEKNKQDAYESLLKERNWLEVERDRLKQMSDRLKLQLIELSPDRGCSDDPSSRLLASPTASGSLETVPSILVSPMTSRLNRPQSKHSRTTLTELQPSFDLHSPMHTHRSLQALASSHSVPSLADPSLRLEVLNMTTIQSPMKRQRNSLQERFSPVPSNGASSIGSDSPSGKLGSSTNRPESKSSRRGHRHTLNIPSLRSETVTPEPELTVPIIETAADGTVYFPYLEQKQHFGRKRSFGAAPASPGSSRAVSRSPSRAGSRVGSRAGSRAGSRVGSPSSSPVIGNRSRSGSGTARINALYDEQVSQQAELIMEQLQNRGFRTSITKEKINLKTLHSQVPMARFTAGSS
eukprot:GILK01006829.1.p1 GENE.GILK01006829.1~~GILK01006829.1.p1  ORF type:complete len:602 (-),score=111.63 GILK01006829.1:221-1798(-)